MATIKGAYLIDQTNLVGEDNVIETQNVNYTATFTLSNNVSYTVNGSSIMYGDDMSFEGQQAQGFYLCDYTVTPELPSELIGADYMDFGNALMVIPSITVDFGTTEQEVTDLFYNYVITNGIEVVEETPLAEITYNGETIAQLNAGDKATIPCKDFKMRTDVVVKVNKVEGGGGATPTLISKTITENGTYNAIDEGADGFSSITVNVEGARPTLNAPTVTLDGSTLTITDSTENGGFTESFDIYNNGVLVANTESATFDLSTLFTEVGDYIITVKAKGTNFNDSAESNSVTYSISDIDDSVITGTWVFSDTVKPIKSGDYYGFGLNFVSNGQSFTVIKSDGKYNNSLSYDSVNAYSFSSNTWNSDNYKTITITGGSDVASNMLFNWLKTYATKTANL